MGDVQSSHVSGKPTLFEKISEDIGSGNEGDMLDMQCTLNQDPSVTPPELLNRKETMPASDFTIQSMETTQESVLTEEGFGGSIRREELTSSTRKIVLGENPEEEEEIELMFKLME
jgi:hypothetical protein